MKSAPSPGIARHIILSDEQTSPFNRDGFLIVRGLFAKQEADILLQAARADAAFQKHAYIASNHPFYQPLIKVSDSALEEIGAKNFSETAEFWNPSPHPGGRAGQDRVNPSETSCSEG